MSADHVVFVYGTLTDPDCVEEVLGRFRYAGHGAATLHGLHRVEGEYPTLAPGGSVEGRLLAVDRAGLDALDDYEGVDRGLYVRVALPCTHPAVESTRVWTYVGDPDALDAAADWSGAAPFGERVRAVLDEVSATVGPPE